jgi:hypothetical protein
MHPSRAVASRVLSIPVAIMRTRVCLGPRLFEDMDPDMDSDMDNVMDNMFSVDTDHFDVDTATITATLRAQSPRSPRRRLFQ